jgi:tRNA-dihydrouridine synthase B
MQIYLAPLQGLTDWIFRESFVQHFGQFDKTFSPFIRVQNTEFYRPSQCNDILLEHNALQQPIPQFLGNDAASFSKFEALCLQYNYTEANINMGCPYPMVTGKKMGAGLLAHPAMVSQLLKGVFANTQLKVSVKCRLGLEDPSQFEAIIPILNDYPIEEVILHPRIGKQQYKGVADRDAFAHYASQIKHSICYNGDIKNIEDVRAVQQTNPQIDKFMIGRALLENPFLLSELRGEVLSDNERALKLRGFHDALIENCKQKYSGDLHFLKRMEEFWEYHHLYFEDGRKIFKQIKKSKTRAQYEAIVFQGIK